MASASDSTAAKVDFAGRLQSESFGQFEGPSFQVPSADAASRECMCPLSISLEPMKSVHIDIQ
jgi:hypothetical protein